MIKISNGENVIQVTNGAYESIYKRMGYQPVGKAKREKPAKVEKPVVEEQDFEEDERPFGGKPIANWSKDEVKQFARENGIDLAGTENVTQAKERIQAWIDEQ